MSGRHHGGGHEDHQQHKAKPPAKQIPPAATPAKARSPELLAQTVLKALYEPGFTQSVIRYVVLPCGANEEQKPCCVRSLSVKCAHGKRGFVLTPPKTKTDATGTQLIQMISEGDSDTAMVTFQGGPCNKGHQGWPAVRFEGKEHSGSFDTKVEAPRQLLSGAPVFLDTFLRYFIGKPEDGFTSAEGSVECCQGGEEFDFKAEVYPYRSWSGQITAGYEFGHATTNVRYNDYSSGSPVEKEARVYSMDDTGIFKFGGEIKAKYLEHESTVRLPNFESETEESHGGAVFGGMKKFFEHTLPRMRVLFLSDPTLTINILWPKIVLGGKAETVEVKGKYNVAWEGNCNLQAAPLIGLSGTLDLLSLAIRGITAAPPWCAPWVGERLAKLKQRAETGFNARYGGAKAVCRIDLIASGQVGGVLGWNFLAEGGNSAKGALTADLDLSLKGQLSAEMRFLKVEYTAGVKIVSKSVGTGATTDTMYGDSPGVRGSMTATFDGEDPLLRGTLLFKGLKLEGVAVHHSGGLSESERPDGTADVEMRKQSGSHWKPEETVEDEFPLFSFEFFEPHMLYDSASNKLSAQ